MDWSEFRSSASQLELFSKQLWKQASNYPKRKRFLPYREINKSGLLTNWYALRCLNGTLNLLKYRMGFFFFCTLSHSLPRNPCCRVFSGFCCVSYVLVLPSFGESLHSVFPELRAQNPSLQSWKQALGQNRLPWEMGSCCRPAEIEGVCNGVVHRASPLVRSSHGGPGAAGFLDWLDYITCPTTSSIFFSSSFSTFLCPFLLFPLLFLLELARIVSCCPKEKNSKWYKVLIIYRVAASKNLSILPSF